MKKTLSTLLTVLLCLMAAGEAVTYAQSYEPVPVTVSRDKVKIGGKMYYSHIVLERQTLYSISRAYGVTIQEIVDMNPAVSADGSGLTKNSILLIPVKDVETAPAASTEGAVETGEFRTHTVKWYENLDDIAALYGVSVKDIMDANELTSKAVKSRQVLRIPVRATVISTDAPIEYVDTVAASRHEPQPEDSSLTFTTEPADTVEAPAYTGTNQVDLTLLLSLTTEKGFNGINMDIYSGVLMALKQLESEGIGTTLNVYDIAGGRVPGLDTLSKARLIIGPSAPADIENVLKVTGDSLITLISPLDPKSARLAEEKQTVFHAAANNDYQLDDLAQWLSQESGRKIAVVVPRSDKGSIADKIKKALAEEGVSYTSVSDGSGMYSTLRKGKYTDIVLASENEYTVTDMLTTLETLSKEYSFNTYATNKVRNFKELDTEIFYPVQMHIVSAYYTDENDNKVSDFFSRYWSVFQFEPNQFAQQGYDVAYYFVKLYSIYGEKWKEYAPELDMRLLHSDIKMRPNARGSLVNKAIRRVVYHKDMTVTLEP